MKVYISFVFILIVFTVGCSRPSNADGGINKVVNKQELLKKEIKANHYVLVISTNSEVCSTVLNKVNESMVSSPNNYFKKIDSQWSLVAKSYLSDPNLFGRIYYLNIDINNDGKNDLLIKLRLYVRGILSDIIFRVDNTYYNFVNGSKILNFQNLYETNKLEINFGGSLRNAYKLTKLAKKNNKRNLIFSGVNTLGVVNVGKKNYVISEKLIGRKNIPNEGMLIVFELSSNDDLDDICNFNLSINK